MARRASRNFETTPPCAPPWRPCARMTACSPPMPCAAPPPTSWAPRPSMSPRSSTPASNSKPSPMPGWCCPTPPPPPQRQWPGLPWPTPAKPSSTVAARLPLSKAARTPCPVPRESPPCPARCRSPRMPRPPLLEWMLRLNNAKLGQKQYGMQPSLEMFTLLKVEWRERNSE